MPISGSTMVRRQLGRRLRQLRDVARKTEADVEEANLASKSKLWRIDADSFAVTEHEIGLQGKERWDIGFAALAFAAGGNLYAMTSTGNSAWKIDLARGSASAVEFYSPPVKPCALTTELVNRFEKKRNS